MLLDRALVQKPLSASPVWVHAGLFNLLHAPPNQTYARYKRTMSQNHAKRVSANRKVAIGGSVNFAVVRWSGRKICMAHSPLVSMKFFPTRLIIQQKRECDTRKKAALCRATFGGGVFSCKYALFLIRVVRDHCIRRCC